MENHDLPAKVDAFQRGRSAESLLAAMFEKAGWHLRPGPSDKSGPDLVVRRKGLAYAVKIKAAAEGRSDRLVPLFAQAACFDPGPWHASHETSISDQVVSKRSLSAR